MPIIYLFVLADVKRGRRSLSDYSGESGDKQAGANSSSAWAVKGYRKRPTIGSQLLLSGLDRMM